MTKRKPSDRDLEILKIIWSHGGETTEDVVADEMKLERGWARVYLHRLGKDDLIDIYRSGKIRMTYKGRLALGVSEVPPSPSYFQGGKRFTVREESGSETIKAIRRLWRE